ncbi:hypothetical protein COOONC_01595 [Cooperia oncophora]
MWDNVLTGASETVHGGAKELATTHGKRRIHVLRASLELMMPISVLIRLLCALRDSFRMNRNVPLLQYEGTVHKQILVFDVHIVISCGQRLILNETTGL